MKSGDTLKALLDKATTISLSDHDQAKIMATIEKIKGTGLELLDDAREKRLDSASRIAEKMMQLHPNTIDDTEE